jgi:multimeric flavodoxin WrbA
MQISIINGSPRSNGATARILKEAAAYLADKYHAEVLWVNLGQITPFQQCRGCETCYRTGKCLLADDDGIEEIANRIKQSDGVIMGSPTYASNISGLLKSFMDRGHFIVEQSLYGKSSFSVATYEIADGQETLKVLNKFFLVSGAARRGELLAKLPFNTEPFIQPILKKQLHHRLDIFARAITQQKAKSWYERMFNDWIVVQLIWKPLFMQQSQRYTAVLDLWKQKNII